MKGHGLRANRRRRLLLGGASAVLGAAALGTWRLSRSAQAFAPSAETHRFDIAIDAAAVGTPLNRRVLGSNVGWAFNGDNMLVESGGFDPAMLALARRLGPTTLRYPGGTYSDVFHWEQAQNEHVFLKRAMPTTMDTRRLLELCEATGAEPIFTVNVVTGTPEEAARWLRATNIDGFVSSVTGKPLPRVAFWEIGNEPYLKEALRPDLALAPEEFARRANAFIRALRAVDPSIRIGLPLTTDTRNGVPATPYPGFTRKVLALITERFDFVSLHDAYMPFGNDRPGDAERLYWGAMAGASAVAADIAEMQALLATLRPQREFAFALTEYSPLFTLGKGATDDWISAPAGALYVADLLTRLARMPEVLMANHWSLSANGRFGAIHADRRPRPVYEALRLVGEALQGVGLPTRVDASSVQVAGIGAVSPVAALPRVGATAARSQGAGGAATLRVLVINRDPRRAAVGAISIAGGSVADARLDLLGCDDVLDASDADNVLRRLEKPLTAASRIELTLPAHSVGLVTLGMARA